MVLLHRVFTLEVKKLRAPVQKWLVHVMIQEVYSYISNSLLYLIFIQLIKCIIKKDWNWRQCSTVHEKKSSTTAPNQFLPRTLGCYAGQVTTNQNVSPKKRRHVYQRNCALPWQKSIRKFVIIHFTFFATPYIHRIATTCSGSTPMVLKLLIDDLPKRVSPFRDSTFWVSEL